MRPLRVTLSVPQWNPEGQVRHLTVLVWEGTTERGPLPDHLAMRGPCTLPCDTTDSKMWAMKQMACFDMSHCDTIYNPICI